MDGNLGKETNKPCRACHDFKSWSKLQGTKTKESEKNLPTTQKETSGKECPLDKDELGSNTWNFLHTMAAYYPDKPTDRQKQEISEFFNLFSRFYPCSICAEDLQKQIQRFPPKTESQHELTQWLCRVHNRINLRLGKPQFDCKKVNERWRDGWTDGSCD